jgi:uncharacterized protein YndB with AHSA1/START domain
MLDTEVFNVSPDCEIVTIRVINAPRETVFRAWTDPHILQKWWGPAGFTNTFKEFDLRPGGKWSFIMHGPDKGDYQNECVFLTIENPALLAWDRLSRPLFRVVTTFDETPDGNTKLIFRMQFDSKESCNKIKAVAGEKNEENFDKLEAVIAEVYAKA